MATFSRALPKNLQELSQIVQSLKDSVSARTLLKLLPFVEDPDYEIEEVEKQKEEDVRRQQELFSQGSNTPPDETEEEEDVIPDDEEEEQNEPPREEDKEKGKDKDKR